MTSRVEQILTIITDAYINTIQDLSNDEGTTQLININCEANAAPSRSQSYIDCLNLVSGSDYDDYSDSDKYNLCSFNRKCELNDINVGQNITITAENTDSDDFRNSFKSNLESAAIQYAYNGGSDYTLESIYGGDYNGNYEQIIDTLFSDTEEGTFNQQIQQFIADQQINVVGGRALVTVKLNEYADLISSQLQSIYSSSSTLENLADTVLETETAEIESGLSELIIWIVYIVMIIAAVILLIVIIYLFVQYYNLALF